MGGASVHPLNSEPKWISNGRGRGLYSTQAEALSVRQLARTIPVILECVMMVLETKLH
jgi:hypothetical protein